MLLFSPFEDKCLIQCGMDLTRRAITIGIQTILILPGCKAETSQLIIPRHLEYTAQRSISSYKYVNHTLGLLTANLNKSMTIPAFDLNTDLIPTFNVSDKDLHAMIRDESILEKLNLIKYHMPIFPDLSDLSNPLNQGAYQFWAIIFTVTFLVVIIAFKRAIHKLLKRCLCKKN